jgi:hypothetical protein
MIFMVFLKGNHGNHGTKGAMFKTLLGVGLHGAKPLAKLWSLGNLGSTAG